MVHCVVFGCGCRRDWDKGIGFYLIPSVIKNKSAFEEELTINRKGKWIQARQDKTRQLYFTRVAQSAARLVSLGALGSIKITYKHLQ